MFSTFRKKFLFDRYKGLQLKNNNDLVTGKQNEQHPIERESTLLSLSRQTTFPKINLKKNTRLTREKTLSLETDGTTFLSRRKQSLFHQDDDSFSVVAALEFGTSYSGYAYCNRREGKSVAQQIIMNPQWISPDKTMSSVRVPSYLLLTDKKEFEAFGYEAEKRYLDLMKEGKHTKYYYFKRYKTKLFGNHDLRGSSLITDENGKQVSALKVYSYTLRYLKSHVLNDLDLQGKDLEAEDIRWVVTIPAIWPDLTKQFMRQAAVKAGIPGAMLKLCLEPEAASIYCQNVPSGMWNDKLPIFKSGTKYAVANLGGGLTDVIFHEKRKDGLRETSRGGGSKIGGGGVDNIFEQFLTKLLGVPIAQAFQELYHKEFIAMMHDFEMQKRLVTPKTTSCIELKIPSCLEVLCHKQQYNDTLANVIFRSVYKGRVKIANHKLKIDAVVSNEFFRAVTIEMAKCISHLLTYVTTAKDVHHLVLTGAFPLSEAVQEIIHTELIDKTQIKQIIVPPGSDVAVLKGAVMFGHNPSTIISRVNRATIGLRIARLFNPEMHETKRRTVLHGIEYIVDIFSPFLTIGARVPTGFIAHQALTTTEPNQKKIVIDVYKSGLIGHSYVDDEGCENLGKIEFEIPMPSQEGRTIYVDFVLGDTELYVFVVDKKTTLRTKYFFPVMKDK